MYRCQTISQSMIRCQTIRNLSAEVEGTRTRFVGNECNSPLLIPEYDRYNIHRSALYARAYLHKFVFADRSSCTRGKRPKELCAARTSGKSGYGCQGVEGLCFIPHFSFLVSGRLDVVHSRSFHFCLVPVTFHLSSPVSNENVSSGHISGFPSISPSVCSRPLLKWTPERKYRPKLPRRVVSTKSASQSVSQSVRYKVILSFSRLGMLATPWERKHL